ncbi:hypothetical protein HUA74_28575 [Myxococcus sp. CA051A]|uniref:hypothetical protein n=1 Tax=Myxococcus sp. CA051A TaxID=2741739 RepID=UPI00157ACE02|nr:hypothetical protein [Myxococcus sp. CA051A]NTX64610.1 hypothetical protein [Myxococcus sp. CA051A]
MSRDENARYLESIRPRSALAPIKLWMKLLPFILVAYVAAYFMVTGGKTPKLPSTEELSRSGSQLGFVLLVGGVLAVGTLGSIFWRRWSAHRKIDAAFLHPDVSALLAVYEQVYASSSRFPDVAFYRASSRALAHACYGDAASARRELASVDWSARPPVIRAMERVGEASIVMLCEDDPARGLALAKEALSMVEFPSPVAGSDEGRAYYEICVGIGEVLTGTATPDSLAALKVHNQQTNLPVAWLMSAWGLRVASAHAGDTVGAEVLRKWLQKDAPHCAPLHRIPG